MFISSELGAVFSTNCFFTFSPLISIDFVYENCAVFADDLRCGTDVEAQVFQDVCVLDICLQSKLISQKLCFQLVYFCFSNSTCCAKGSEEINEQRPVE